MPHLESSLYVTLQIAKGEKIKNLFLMAVFLRLLFLEALGKVLGSQLLQPRSRIPPLLAHTFGK